MSIYPKNISNGENLIIHLRFGNKSNKIQKVRYVLSVIDPDNNDIFYKEDDLTLGIRKDEFVKQLYYSLYINKRFKPGKYMVNFYMICNGQIIESSTKDNDYFYIEKLKYYNFRGKTIVFNCSKEKTHFKLYKGINIEEFTIDGGQELTFEDNYDYIEYANNRFDNIKNRK